MKEIKDNLFSKDYGDRFVCLLALLLLDGFRIHFQYERYITHGYIPPEVRFSNTHSNGFFDLILNTGEEAMRAIYSPDYRELAVPKAIKLTQRAPFLVKIEDSKTFFLYFMECLEKIYTASSGNAVTNPVDETDNKKPYSWNTFKHVIVPYYNGDLKAVEVHCDKKQAGTESGIYSLKIKTIIDGISLANETILANRSGNEPKIIKNLHRQSLEETKNLYKKLGFPYEETYPEYLRFLKLNFQAMNVKVNSQSFTIKAESIFDLFIPFE